MARFTTRIELHDAEYEDYLKLYENMDGEGFSDVIQSDKGVWYRLPPAEYNREGNLTVEQVLESAKRAASGTGRRFTVLVTESVRRKWDGLEEVRVRR